jgi:hypothetical protein
MLIAGICVTGCNSPISENPNDYVGEYVYKPSNHPIETFPQQFASFVILKKDHVAVEIRFVRRTGKVLTTEEKWYLDRGGSFPDNLVIGNFGAPIELSGSTIRLRINGDVDEYYEKVR